MYSSEIPIWRILAHIFGFHFWSKPKSYRNPRYGPNPPATLYKVCSKEQVIYWHMR